MVAAASTAQKAYLMCVICNTTHAMHDIGWFVPAVLGHLDMYILFSLHLLCTSRNRMCYRSVFELIRQPIKVLIKLCRCVTKLL